MTTKVRVKKPETSL